MVLELEVHDEIEVKEEVVIAPPVFIWQDQIVPSDWHTWPTYQTFVWTPTLARAPSDFFIPDYSTTAGVC